MSLYIKNWNQKIQEEIQEIEFLIETEEFNLQNVNIQIREFSFELFQPNGPTKQGLLNQQKFIINSIRLLENHILVLRNKKIFCC